MAADMVFVAGIALCAFGMWPWGLGLIGLAVWAVWH